MNGKKREKKIRGKADREKWRTSKRKTKEIRD